MLQMLNKMPGELVLAHERNWLRQDRLEAEGNESTTTHTDGAIRLEEQALGRRPDSKRGAKYKARRKDRSREFNNRPGQLPPEERQRIGRQKAVIKRAMSMAALRNGDSFEYYENLHEAGLSVEDAFSRLQLQNDIVRLLGRTAGITIKFHQPGHSRGFPRPSRAYC